jgi:hypothetical protein
MNFLPASKPPWVEREDRAATLRRVFLPFCSGLDGSDGYFTQVTRNASPNAWRDNVFDKWRSIRSPASQFHRMNWNALKVCRDQVTQSSTRQRMMRQSHQRLH